MKVLVTGASGFVAPYAAIELEQNGHKPILTTLSSQLVERLGRRWPALRCDLSDRAAVEKLIRRVKPDAVLHLAGNSRSHGDSSVDTWFESNVVTTMNLCRALELRKKPALFLFASTAFVYDMAKTKNTALDEKSLVAPWTPYGFSKLAGEQVVWAHAGGPVSGYVVRSFNHVGPGQSGDFVCAALASRVARAKSGSTVLVGNVSAIRDFSDVRDVVRAYRLILEKRPAQRLFVLGSGKGVMIRSVLDHYIALSGKKVQVKTSQPLLRRGDPGAVVANPALAKRYLGWQCRIPLEQTLADIYASVQKA